MDLREFIAVLRLDLYKYRDYPTGQKPCDNPQMRLRYGNHRTTTRQFPCELLNTVLVDWQQVMKDGDQYRCSDCLQNGSSHKTPCWRSTPRYGKLRFACDPRGSQLQRAVARKRTRRPPSHQRKLLLEITSRIHTKKFSTHTHRPPGGAALAGQFTQAIPGSLSLKGCHLVRKSKLKNLTIQSLGMLSKM